jgi:CheY-specific phosphatase CheX
VFDAVGEITNLIAGQFKVLLADQINVRVGVPLAMKGRVFMLGGSRALHGMLNVDQRAVWLVVTGTKTN